MTTPTCRSCGTNDPTREWVPVGVPEVWLCQPECVRAYHLLLHIGDRVHTVHPWEADGLIIDLPGPELAVVLADDGRKAHVDLYLRHKVGSGVMELARYTTELAEIIIEAENTARDAEIARARCEAPWGETARQYAQDIADATDTAVGARRMLHSLIDDEYKQLCSEEV